MIVMAGSKDFCEYLQAQLQLQGRLVRCEYESQLGGRFVGETYEPRTDTVFVHFYNLPIERVKEKRGNGAEAENNRMLFCVEGFAKFDPHGEPPKGKVKLETLVSMLDRKYKLRGKTDTPAKVAAYLATFLNKVVKQVPPNYTHERMG